MELDGSAAIVTGGASGLGEATARALVDRGARVVLVDLQDDKGEEVAKELGASLSGMSGPMSPARRTSPPPSRRPPSSGR